MVRIQTAPLKRSMTVAENKRAEFVKPRSFVPRILNTPPQAAVFLRMPCFYQLLCWLACRCYRLPAILFLFTPYI